MRNTEERVRAVLARTEALRRQRRRTLLGAGLLAACLLLAVGLSLTISTLESTGVHAEAASAAASLLAESGTLGYAVTAILSFLLGITGTMLCLVLRRRPRNGDRS